MISEGALARILAALEGAHVLCGGERLDRAGWWLGPTIIEDVSPGAALSRTELFGPVTILYRARDFEHALALVNDSPYGFTSAIHTRSLDRALLFAGGRRPALWSSTAARTAPSRTWASEA